MPPFVILISQNWSKVNQVCKIRIFVRCSIEKSVDEWYTKYAVKKGSLKEHMKAVLEVEELVELYYFLVSNGIYDEFLNYLAKQKDVN